MITDEILEAIDLFAAMCCNGEEAAKLEALREMLKDFAEDDWLGKNDAEKKDWMEGYLA